MSPSVHTSICFGAPPTSEANRRPSRSASGRNGRIVSLASAASTLTANGTNSPASASWTMSAMVSPALSCASRVEAPRCGVTTTCSSSNSGDSVVGSVANTSSAAPAITPSRIASARSRFVDDAAASDVDHSHRRLGLDQQIAVDEAGRLLGLRQVDREEVGLGDGLVERQQFDTHLPCPVGGHERVVGDDVHAERLGPIGDELADATEADRPPSVLSASSTPSHRDALPATGGQRGVGLRDVAGLGEQQRHRVLGGGDDVALRGVDHHHAAAGGRLDVDVVEADAGAADDEQLVGVLEDLGGDLGRRSDDQRLRAADVHQQIVEIELHVDVVACGAEPIEATFGDFFSDKDPGHCNHRYRRNRGFEKN